MAKKKTAQQPLMLRAHRLMEAFAKSDDERDFYLDSVEGYIVYVDLDKSEEELNALFSAFDKEAERFYIIPKMTFYESKKIMEGFVHDKVYDIDTKEKLIDIIQSKDPREHFLEFLFDQEAELEKWQQFYQERSRVRIIEWLREYEFQFVFEEDLDFSRSLMEKIKTNIFSAKVPKEVTAARKMIQTKAKTYYSNEALNPRPKRGRPPKQQQKTELEPQISVDIFTDVPQGVRPFIFKPDISTPSMASFSSKYDTEQELLAHRGNNGQSESSAVLESLNQKLATLRKLSDNWLASEDGDTQVSNEEQVLAASLEKPAPKKKAAKKTVKKAVKKSPAPKKKAK